jgi:hypothetical protein
MPSTSEIHQYRDVLRAGWSEFHRRQRKELFLYSTESRPALKPTQPPIKWVPGAISSGAKQPGSETDHSLPSSADVKNGGAILPLPHTFSCRGA